MPDNYPEFLPKGRCLSTLQPTKEGVHFSATAVRELWGGHRVRPILDFRKEDFLTIQRETAGRISISGVQDKISLRLDRKQARTYRNQRRVHSQAYPVGKLPDVHP